MLKKELNCEAAKGEAKKSLQLFSNEVAAINVNPLMPIVALMQRSAKILILL